MKETILLNYDENVKLVAEEEKNKFLHQLLTNMGIPIGDIWDLNSQMSPVVKANVRNLLMKYKVIVDDEIDELIVSFDGKTMGRWNKPFYKLKKDPSQIGKKQLYVALELDYWSIFEENNEK